MSEDSRFLLILVCMLDSSAFSPTFLSFGATTRKRWTEQGHIGNAACVGLVSELRTLLSDVSRLQGAFDELENGSMLTKACDDRYTVDAATRSRVLTTLLPEAKQFWRCQAFFVICHAVPWKYLESLCVFSLFGAPASMLTLYLDHLNTEKPLYHTLNTPYRPLEIMAIFGL